MLQRPDYRLLPWWWIGASLALSGVGIAFVASATWDPGGPGWISREADAQLAWLGIGIGMCAVILHIQPAAWRRLSIPLWLGAVAVVLLMTALAGTALVPRIKGQANWLVLGSLRLQPVELVKMASLLGCAAIAAGPNFDARKLWHCLILLAAAGIPSLLVAAGEDLGSAMTFVPMAVGLLILSGMRLRWLVAGLVLLAGLLVAGYQMLPDEGPKAYRKRRIEAWRHPDRYALAEAYQTERSVRSIGSGQWTGKGYMAGDQNRLGWVPEKHTDMIFAVVGEETGFAGSAGLAILLLAWCGAGLYAAARAPGPWGRSCAGGLTCLVAGQAGINLAVATGLMPVTGVTLPFISYGGSSLVMTWVGLGIGAAAAGAKREN